MHKALHLKDDIDRLYVTRKEGRECIEDCIVATIQGIKKYTKSWLQQSVIAISSNLKPNKKITMKTKPGKTTVWILQARNQ